MPSFRTTLPLVLLVLIALSGFYTYFESGNASGPFPSGFTVGGRSFTFTYLATTSTQRTEGLMNKLVTNSTTMLFVFPSLGQPKFWMYDTKTSLDMIWINSNGTSGHVVYLVTNAQPCFVQSSCTIYTPTSDSNYVIEARGGFAAANGVAVGTEVHFIYH